MLQAVFVYVAEIVFRRVIIIQIIQHGEVDAGFAYFQHGRKVGKVRHNRVHRRRQRIGKRHVGVFIQPDYVAVVCAGLEHIHRPLDAPGFHVHHKVDVVFERFVVHGFQFGAVHARFLGVGEAQINTVFKGALRHVFVKTGYFQQNRHAVAVVGGAVRAGYFTGAGSVPARVVVRHNQHASVAFAGYLYPQVFDVVFNGAVFIQQPFGAEIVAEPVLFRRPVVFFHFIAHVPESGQQILPHFLVIFLVKNRMWFFAYLFEISGGVFGGKSACVGRR